AGLQARDDAFGRHQLGWLGCLGTEQPTSRRWQELQVEGFGHGFPQRTRAKGLLVASAASRLPRAENSEEGPSGRRRRGIPGCHEARPVSVLALVAPDNAA